MTARAAIGLGSNLGDSPAALRFGIEALTRAAGADRVRVSRWHETMPVGGPPDQRPYLNAAATLETDLGPSELLALLHRIEADAGRVRQVRWAARTLDLDLLLHDDRILDSPDLVVPHPRMVVRRFVLAPLSEIAPQWIEPRTGRTIAELLDRLDHHPRTLDLSDLPDIVREEVLTRLSERGGWTVGSDDPLVRVLWGAGPIPLDPTPTIRAESVAEVLAVCDAVS